MRIREAIREAWENWRHASSIAEEPYWRKKGHDDDRDHRRAEAGQNRMGDRFHLRPVDFFDKHISSLRQREWKHHPKATAPEQIIEGSTHERIAEFMKNRKTQQQPGNSPEE